ncbi:MAG: hypothetical protein E6K70_19820 [Planctomycetota bacterium]|nr:MAG: hypothetical protein E6K70_19820 [Planctomycetota bacterium]
MTVFADTFALIAWLNPRDDAHALVTACLDGFTGRLVTTEWVLMELAGAHSPCRGSRSSVKTERWSVSRRIMNGPGAFPGSEAGNASFLLHQIVTGEHAARAAPILGASRPNLIGNQGTDLSLQCCHPFFKRCSGHNWTPASREMASCA